MAAPNTPKQLMNSLIGHLLVDDLEILDGPYAISDTKSVVYVKPNSGGPKLRIEVTQ